MSKSQGFEGDFIGADRYDLGELRSAAFGKSTTVSRQLAVALLGRKQYAKKADDFGRLLANEAEEPRLRIMAAAELGRMGTAPALKRLNAALSVKEPRVLQSVVEATAGAGSAEALPAVRALRRRTLKSLVVAADAASELLALRTGARSDPLPAPPKRTLMTLDEKLAQPVTVRKLDQKAAENIVTAATAGSLKLDLTPRAAVRARCGPREFALLFSRLFLDDVPVALKKRMIALAVAEQDHLEHKGWDVRYLIVAQPTANGIELHALNRSGHLAFFGHATIENDSSVGFLLQTVDRPGAVPVVVAGKIADDRLRIDRFASELTGRRRVDSGIQPRPRS